ncbi:FAD binding domain-containing protein [Chelativorans xinjiangense]|uniref:FAD binding domain-containing protein n=1 Tax=Chelativorans xinjiangense TaxID=2681485 RepID=UPI00135A236F|nr:xanthine dehydrogenase family protein subunit M [Chelativorans xinjiangense]
MHQTTYHRASSVSEAVKLLNDADDGKYVAGGQTLIPTMKQRLAAPSDLVDLRHIADLKGIEVSGDKVKIGAAATHAEVAENAALAKACPAFCHLAAHIGDPHVRHMGTVGGSIANNDPAADYPAALLALAATVHTNKREISADDFFVDLFETALEDDEIITAVSLTVPEKAGYGKFPNPASRYALTGVFVARRADGVRAAVTGAGENGVFRAEAIEKALSSSFDASALDGVTIPADGLMTDIHASAEYRANLIAVMAKRAVQAANG